MDELDKLKARIVASNQVMGELIERDINSRVLIGALQNTIEILKQQLLEKNIPAEESPPPIN